MGKLMNECAPTPTDYSDENNWLVWLDEGHDVDVFYLYPTMGRTDPKAAFCDSGDAVMRSIAMDVAPMQILPWAWNANVYAPFYRQAGFALMVPIINSKSGTQQQRIQKVEDLMREEAMEDIYAALDYFFEHISHGKPFILVGHSQGSMLTKIVLEDYRAQHPERFERMIAAYCPGWMFTQEWCDRVGVPFAEGPADTGVLLSWNAERPGPADTFNACSMTGALCINPITWNTATQPSNSSDCRGTLVLDAEAMEAVEIQMMAAFAIDKGWLSSTEDMDQEWLEAATQDSVFIDAAIDIVSVMADKINLKDTRNIYELWDAMLECSEVGGASGAAASDAASRPPFSVQPGIVSARVDPSRGTLVVDYPEEKNFTPKALGKNSLHMLEIPLFFEDLRQNVRDRIDAWKVHCSLI